MGHQVGGNIAWCEEAPDFGVRSVRVSKGASQRRTGAGQGVRSPCSGGRQAASRPRQSVPVTSLPSIQFIIMLRNKTEEKSHLDKVNMKTGNWGQTLTGAFNKRCGFGEALRFLQARVTQCLEPPACGRYQGAPCGQMATVGLGLSLPQTGTRCTCPGLRMPSRDRAPACAELRK